MLIRISLLAMLLVSLGGCKSDLDKVRGEFIDSCMSSGAPKAQCSCAIDKLQEHYGEKGLVAIDKHGYPPMGFAEQVQVAAGQCR